MIMPVDNRYFSGKYYILTAVSKKIKHCFASRNSPTPMLTKMFDSTIVSNAQEAVEFISNILESSTEYSVIGKDLDGRILLWNEGARRVYGYEPEEVVGRANAAILHLPEDVASGRDREIMAIALRDGKYEGTIGRIRKNGEHFSARVVLTPRRDATGKAIGYLLISKDISSETRLLEANRLKSEFLANMSHELRTPLNGIIGFAEFLIDGKPGPLNAKQTEYLGDILTSGRHLLQLINDVLDLAKVEAGRMDLTTAELSLVTAINEVCAVARPIAEKKRMAIRITIDPALDRVTLDPQKFKQILYNLLSNAIKFTDEGGSVHITAAIADEDHFRLDVRDTGIGIREEDFGRLFHEFEQIDSGTSRHYEGTGLGLALTRKLVELHGGAISVSSALGKGSTFSVVLPLRAKAGHE
jgi:PAS domain S-box-containing protein